MFNTSGKSKQMEGSSFNYFKFSHKSIYQYNIINEDTKIGEEVITFNMVLGNT